jgi:hypothetical protein
VLVLAVIIGVGFYVLAANQKTTTNKNSTSQGSSSNSDESSDQPSLTTMYQSTRGGLTLYYPKAWLLTGYKNGQVVTPLDGDEDRLVFRTASETSSKVDNFGGELRVLDAAPGDSAWPLYPSGTIVQTLKNGISIWRDNQVQILQKGRTTNTCPSIRAASNDAFGYQLNNGKWLAFTGSFCWTAGMTTSYSFGQQRDSSQFAQAVSILGSIKQSPTPQN